MNDKETLRVLRKAYCRTEYGPTHSPDYCEGHDAAVKFIASLLGFTLDQVCAVETEEEEKRKREI